MLQTQPATSAQPHALIDVDAQRLANDAASLTTRTTNFVCNTREQFREGGEHLRTIKRLQDALEAKRTSVTKPLNGVLDTINGWFKSPADALKAAKLAVGNRMGHFEASERERERQAQAKADQEAREQREELERRAKAAAAKGNETKAQELVARAEAVEAKPVDIIAPKAAGTSIGEHWEFEVTDRAQLPAAYMIPDMVKIGQMVRALKNKEHAEKQIPGIRVWSRAKISVRS